MKRAGQLMESIADLDNPFSRICNSGGENISICNAEKQRYAAAVIRQPHN